MTDRELMQMALDWLDDGCGKYTDEYQNLIEALRARLAQPEPEPVAWMYNGNLHEFDPSDWAEGEVIPLYTAPPQRKWQGLTDEEILEEYRQAYGDDGDLTDVYFARAIEAKLKEKNT